MSIEEAIAVLAEPTETAPEAPAQEAKPEAKTEAETKDDPKISKRFAALSKEEKRLQATKKEIEAERAAFQSERAEMQAKLEEATKATDMLRLAKENPIEFFKETGVSFDKLADAMLNDDGSLKTKSEIAAVKREMDEKIEALKKEREEEKTAKQKEEEKRKLEADQKFVQETIADYQKYVNTTIEKNPDAYELIIAQEAQSKVWDVIEAFFWETKEILDPDVAAEHVEKHLHAQAEKLLGTKKFSATSKAAVRDKQSDARDTPRPSRTLTNANAVPAADLRNLSEKEQFALAVSMLE